MNNLGMNPMGMNPMLMNNIGMIGMNNQPNLMDQTALNVKSIIEPYENKIRELEEIIKQKDFEIIVLKQKLNNKNMNPMININMNPMMNININPFPNTNEIINNDEISVVIKSNTKTIKCFRNDKASSIEKKLILTYNYEPFYDKPLGEYGISNGSVINIADKIYNVRFDATSGLKKVLNLDGDCPIKEAIKLYFHRINKENFYQMLLDNQIHLSFIYNNVKLNIRDERPLNIIFSARNPVVTVNDLNQIIGGK